MRKVYSPACAWYGGRASPDDSVLDLVEARWYTAALCASRWPGDDRIANGRLWARWHDLYVLPLQDAR